MQQKLHEPTWSRLGFSYPPEEDAGKDIGIVIIDTIRPHNTIRHLGSRIKYISVHNDLSVECREIAFEEPNDSDGDKGEHGLMAVLALSHEPFEFKGIKYTGLSPGSNFIVLNHLAFKEGEGERLKRGIDYILERSQEWNIKIILSMGWNALDNSVLLKNTSENSTVQALASAVKSGILVICANGNTRLENIMPPIEYLAVGGYNDHGSAKIDVHSTYPDEPWGRNGDGHIRPDVLAPRVYLPIPYCETLEKPNELSYFWGTSGASTLVTGVCAYLLSKYPNLQIDTLRNALVDFGIPFVGYDNLAPRVNVSNVIEALNDGYQKSGVPHHPSPIDVQNPSMSIISNDPIERGLAFSILVKQERCSREELWRFAHDDSPVVRKIAIWALQKPKDANERKIYWENLSKEKEGGVRGWYAYGLLQDATKNEIDLWIPWTTDLNWTVRWCINGYLDKFPEFPELEKTHDPDSILDKALPIYEWYEKYKMDIE
ncbi:S8 family serine peptidase [Paenibacillus sp. FSL H7-0714]|uniref:S8 family serine peptidase n=1 Tax=Paenibacillus sp. FSL H7-0714 TaxID=2954735 RepID=UPI0030F6072E